MALITAAVVLSAAAVSAAVQLYNSEKTRGANKARLKEIEELYNSLVPPDYDLTIIDPPDAHAQKLQSPEFSGPEAAPKWDMSKLEPEKLKLVEKYIPTIAPRIYEEYPVLLEKSQDMKQGESAQKEALKRFMEIAEGGYDPELQQRLMSSRQQSQADAQSRSESMMQDFERRGLGGSGLELAANIGSNAQAMNRNASLGLQAESEAYRNQLNALAQGAQLGGQLYSQDMNMQGRNADVINAFNQRMSKRHQDWESMRAEMLNRADLTNMQEAQRIADYNTKSSNDASIRDRQRADTLMRYNTDFNSRERDRQDQLSKWNYNNAGAERAYQDQKDLAARRWEQGNVDRRNALIDREYQNRVNQVAGRAGQSQRMSELETRAAQDRNQAVQGLSNLGAAYAMRNNAPAAIQPDDPMNVNKNKYALNYQQGGIYG